MNVLSYSALLRVLCGYLGPLLLIKPQRSRSAAEEQYGSYGTAVSSTSGAATGALMTTRTSRQCLVLDIGRLSIISTVSPWCDSFFSSCTWQIVRRRMYLP